MPSPRRVLRAASLRQAARELAYVVAKLPLAFVGFAVALVSLVFGAGLTLTFVGLPLLAASNLVARAFGSAHRWLARVLLGEHVAAPPPFERGTGFLGWLQSALRDAPSWRARLYLLGAFPVAVAVVSAAVVVWGLGAFWHSPPVWWGAPAPEAIVFPLAGLGMLVAAPRVVRRLLCVDRMLMRSWLGPSRSAQRVTALEAARSRVVDDATATLRRIERDLHDGTQAQLATLAMTLGQVKEKLEHRPDVPFDPDGALALAETAHRHAKEALVELRDIARGIHPPALDVGLDAALATLVQRSAVPATLRAEIPARPASSIEAIAYFTVAELLANAAKHSRARRAYVEVACQDTSLSLQVRDDGVGGARPRAGSGLAGLLDRVQAVDGRLHVSSPPGGPTVIDVRLPLRT